jgi:hypothetical protein
MIGINLDSRLFYDTLKNLSWRKILQIDFFW